MVLLASCGICLRLCQARCLGPLKDLSTSTIPTGSVTRDCRCDFDLETTRFCLASRRTNHVSGIPQNMIATDIDL
jgi:hypothetical protein